MNNFTKSFIFICVSLFYSLSAQSKNETETWITETTRQFPAGPIDNRQLKIIGGYFTYFENIGDTVFYERVLIKNVKEIQITERYDKNWGNYYSIKLFCKFKGCNDSGHFINGTYKNTVIQYLENFGYVGVVLNENFNQRDLPKRMEKALLHLVKLYGGNAIIKRSAF